MFLAAFTSAFALCPQATHTKVAWLLRLSDAMCLQVLQVCDVYAAFTFSTRPEAFCSNRPASRPHPDLRMPRLSPAFCATFLPGFCTVPAAEPVMPLTLRFSTRITSNLAARSVLVFSSQSLRRSPSLAFNRPIRVLTFLAAVRPRRARASLRCSRRSRSASFARKPLGLVISPVDSATATVTPRSTPRAPPVAGAGIGSGITANAICQRPARSRVMRYDFQSARARLRLNETQPIFAHQHTGACPVVLPDPQRLGSDDPQTLMLAGFTPRRAPMGSCEERPPPLVKVGQRLLLDGLRPAGKPRRRPPGGRQLCGLGPQARRGPFPGPPHQGLLQAEVPHVPGVAALLQQKHFLCGARVQAEPHGPQSNLGHRHPAGNQTRHPAAAEASPATCTSTWCSPAKYRRGVFDTEMPNRCEQVMAQVRADFGATLAEFNGEVDHVHLLAAYPPKVALSHLVNSLKGVSSSRPGQDFGGRINGAARRGRFGPPSYSAGSCGAPPLSTVKDYITNQKRPD